MKCLSKGQGCRAKIHKCVIQQELSLITSVFVSGKQSEHLCPHRGQKREYYLSSLVKRYPNNGHNLHNADLVVRIFLKLEVLFKLSFKSQMDIEHILFSMRSKKNKTSNSLVTAFFV